MNRTTLTTLACALALLLPWSVMAARLSFSPADILGWDPHRFKGETRYERVTVDGEVVIEARCTEATASGLFRRETIDLTRTPILEWRWRVDEVFDRIDEQRRDGDDFPARLYVVDERRIVLWRTRALNYVWASHQPKDSDWPNPFASQARMIAVRSGAPESSGEWRTERRNVREDFKRHHGRDQTSINAVAIMTDCDNTGQNARAWYGDIRFLPD